MSKILALAGACHPGPTVAVTTVAVLLGAGVGLAPAPLAVLAAAVLTGQLSMGWSNDVVDAGRDAAAGRTDKPAAGGAVSAATLWTAAGTALALSVALSFLLGPRAAIAQLLLVAAGWAYNLGLKATWWSGVAYAVGFAGLPAAPYLARPGAPWPPWWAPVTGALLGVAAHVVNVLPDLRDDLAAGVRGLPHRLGRRGSLALLVLALLGAGGAALAGAQAQGAAPALVVVGGAAVAAGTVAATWLAWRRPDSKAGFHCVVAVAVVDVVLFVVAAGAGG